MTLDALKFGYFLITFGVRGQRLLFTMYGHDVCGM